ncbi:ectopic P granules protein 5 homolog [Anopheles aquasalis]|uniref:ectopic P granules protein 5 homolog n=1 Tax=Anopheles aquasalis TaxID=42839 RepID=UPI00215AB0E0|nr:ectopic P granules protein 5 homolog [Anopheles aquasalis]XP_050100295.1 ectopic P granules protein 5 homolog [Anopheles aquasalis]
MAMMQMKEKKHKHRKKNKEETRREDAFPAAEEDFLDELYENEETNSSEQCVSYLDELAINSTEEDGASPENTVPEQSKQQSEQLIEQQTIDRPPDTGNRSDEQPAEAAKDEIQTEEEAPVEKQKSTSISPTAPPLSINASGSATIDRTAMNQASKIYPSLPAAMASPMQSQRISNITPASKIYPELPAVSQTQQQHATQQWTGVVGELHNGTLVTLNREQISQLFPPNASHELHALKIGFAARECPATICQQQTFNEHPLYILLDEYMRKSVQEVKQRENLRSCRKTYEKLQSEIWRKTSKRFSGTAFCADGKLVTASTVESVMVLDDAIVKRYERAGKEIEERMYELNKTHLATAGKAAEIEDYIRVQLGGGSQDTSNGAPKVQVDGLRDILSILFYFLRSSRGKPGHKSPRRNHNTTGGERSMGPVDSAGDRECFSDNVRGWMRMVAKTIVWFGTAVDRINVMLQLLHCEAGTASWCKELICPLQPSQKASKVLTDDELRQVLKMLELGLASHPERDSFVKPPPEPDDTCIVELNSVGHVISASITDDGLECEAANQQADWLVVDSDGEDCTGSEQVAPLKEDDLSGFLEQIPFADVFETLIAIGGADTLAHGTMVSLHRILRSTTIALEIVRVLAIGLRTYRNQDRYENLIRRLGRLIAHTVHYVADILQMYPNRANQNDPAHKEFQRLVGRAICSFSCLRDSASWHSLLALPFQLLSYPVIWWLYSGLLADVEDWSEGTALSELVPNDDGGQRAVRMDTHYRRLLERSSKDVYYVCQLMVSLVDGRDVHAEAGIFHVVVKDFFQLLLRIDHATQPVLVEYIFSELNYLLSKHPFLCEALIVELQWCAQQDSSTADRLPGAKYLQELFCLLPFRNYSPTVTCVDKMNQILTEVKVTGYYAVLVLEVLRSFDYGAIVNNELWIPQPIQLYILRTVIGAHRQHVPLDLKGMPASSADKPLVEAFDRLCWEIVGKLRVHHLDQPQQHVMRVMHETDVALRDVPAAELLPEIHAGINERRTIAVYAAMLATTTGHWIPVFCQSGAQLLSEQLVGVSRKSVLRCLQLIVPLFHECPESLSSCEPFLNLLSKAIGKAAKERWWSSASEGEDIPEESTELRVYCLASRMVYLQLRDFQAYGLASPAPLVEVWVRCLTALPAWKKCPQVLRMLDIIADLAHHYPDAWNQMKFLLVPHYSQIAEVKASKGTKGLLFMRGNDEESLYNIKPNLIALSMMSYDLEFEITEQELWYRLLVTLTSDPTVPINVALRQIYTQDLGQQDAPPVGDQLVLYKIARQIVASDFKHPMQLFLWQRFIHVYYTMLPSATGGLPAVHGAINRLYEYDKKLLDKLIASGRALCDYYAKLTPPDNPGRTSDTEEAKAAQAQLYQHMAGFFETCLAWLQSDMLDGLTLSTLGTLPASFNPSLLHMCLDKTKNCLPQYNDKRGELHRFVRIRESWKLLFGHYLTPAKVHPRLMGASNASLLRETDPTSILKSMEMRLKGYECPLELGPCECEPPFVPLYRLTVDAEPRAIVAGLEKAIESVIQFATRQYLPAWDNVHHLQEQYSELIPKRYFEEREVKRMLTECRMITKRCTGAVTVSVAVTKTIEREQIRQKMEHNRAKLNEALKAAIHTPAPIMQALHRANGLLMQLNQWITESGALGMQMLPPNHCVRTLVGSFVPKMISYGHLHCPATEHVLEASFAMFMRGVPSLVYDPLVLCVQKALQQSDEAILDFLPYVKAADIPCSHMVQLYTRLLMQNYRSKLEKRVFLTIFDDQFDLAEWLKNNTTVATELEALVRKVIETLCSPDKTSPSTPCNEELDLSRTFHETLLRHLLALLEYNFPVHYELILLELLNGCEQRHLQPEVLLAVNNSLRRQWHVPPLSIAINEPGAPALLDAFVGRQYGGAWRVSIYNMVSGVIFRLSERFVTQRTQNCLHGLYPEYRAYVMPLALTLATLARAYIEIVIPLQISSLKEAETETLSAWSVLCKLFSAWLEPYEKTNLASWIQQFRPNGQQDLLLPWSELYVAEASQMLTAFTYCIESLVAKLNDSMRSFPGGHYDSTSRVLELVFEWYERNFAHRSVANSVLTPVNVQLLTLPWESLQPGGTALEAFERVLDRFAPAAHQFASQIFIRCRWERMPDDFRAMPMADLLTVCIKLAHEPTVHTSGRAAMLETLAKLSGMRWIELEVRAVEQTLDWFVMSADPSIMLQLGSSAVATIDEAILNLLLIVCGLRYNEFNGEQEQSNEDQHRKRELFVRCAVRLLLTYAKRNKKALATTSGVAQFAAAIQRLVENIAYSMINIPEDPGRSIDRRESASGSTLLLQLFDAIKGFVAEDAFPFFTKAVRNEMEKDKPGMHLFVTSVLRGCFLFSDRIPREILLTMEDALYRYFCSNNHSFPSSGLATPEEMIHSGSVAGHECVVRYSGQWIAILNLVDPIVLNSWLVPIEQFNTEGTTLLTLHLTLMGRCILATRTVDKQQTLVQLQKQLSRIEVSTQLEPRLFLLWGMMAYVLMTLLGATGNADEPALQEFLLHLRSILRGPQGTVNRLMQTALSLCKGTVCSPTRRAVVRLLIACLTFCQQASRVTSGRNFDETPGHTTSAADELDDGFHVVEDSSSSSSSQGGEQPLVKLCSGLRSTILEILNEAPGVSATQRNPQSASWVPYLENIRRRMDSAGQGVALAEIVQECVAPLCVDVICVLGGRNTELVMRSALPVWRKMGCV